MQHRDAWKSLVLAMALVVSATATSTALASEPPEATVVLNGVEGTASVVVLSGDGSAPRADDLLQVGGYPGLWMLRGDAPTLRLRTEQGKWFEVGDDGSETLVGLHVSGSSIAAWLLPAAEARALAAKELATLRGLALDNWSDSFSGLLRGIDPARCALDVRTDMAGHLPKLPEGLRALRIHGWLEEPVDLSGLAEQTSLRYLSVRMANVPSWSALAGMTELRHLEAGVEPTAAAYVPALPGLRRYSASREWDVTDISFVARFSALRSLNVRATGVTDLSAIERLTEIDHVEASLSAVTKLPPGRVPSLRRLRILGHSVPNEQLRAFLDANPQCETEHSMRADFEAKVRGAESIRLRTGGQCHRHPLTEDTLLESGDPKELKRLLAAIVLDEPRTRGHCKCCGGPTIEFLRGGEIVESLTVHHGQALRWDGWPGDGPLTSDSADALCDWLNAHGSPVKSPRQVAAREVTDAAAAKKTRDELQDQLLGPEGAAAARATTSSDEFRGALAATEPDADRRIRILVRLWSDGKTDDADAGVRVAARARRVLEGSEPARLARVLLAVLTDPEADAELRRHAAYTVRGLDKALDEEALARLRVPAARVYIAIGTLNAAYAAVRLLGEQETPEAASFALTLLPPVDEDGTCTRAPTNDDMDLLFQIVQFSNESDDPKLRAIVAASRDPAVYGRWLDNAFERREQAEERKKDK